MNTAKPTKEKLQKAWERAQKQNPNAWHPMSSDESISFMGGLLAIKTATGQILVGTGPAFREESLRLISFDPKYGPVISWLQVDARSYT